jgi:hypothetical protein
MEKTPKSIDIGNIGTIVIPKKVQELIDRLHDGIGATEWSGALFYKLVSGDIKKMKDLVFEAIFLYPLDMGTSVYTEYEYNEKLLPVYDICEEALEASRGHLHTHHSMSTFFSSTDTKELLDNSKYHNYYLSLIVNFDGKYSAKIAFPSETTASYTYKIKDTFGKIFNVTGKGSESTILVGNLSIEREFVENDKEKDWLDIQIAELKKPKPVKYNYASSMYGNTKNVYNTRGNDFEYDAMKKAINQKDPWEEHNKKSKSYTIYKPDADHFLACFIAFDGTLTKDEADVDLQIIILLDEQESGELIDLTFIKSLYMEELDDLLNDFTNSKHLLPYEKKQLYRETKKILETKKEMFAEQQDIYDLYINILNLKINE